MKTTSKGGRKTVTSSNGKQVRRTENVLRVEATKFFLPSQDRTETRKTKKGPYKNLNSRQRKKPLHAHLISFPSTKPWRTHSYEKENLRHQQPDSPSDRRPHITCPERFTGVARLQQYHWPPPGKAGRQCQHPIVLTQLSFAFHSFLAMDFTF